MTATSRNDSKPSRRMMMNDCSTIYRTQLWIPDKTKKTWQVFARFDSIAKLKMIVNFESPEVEPLGMD